MEEKLLKMKAEIDEAKARKNRIEGEMDGLRTQLKDKYGYDSIEAAEADLDDLEKSIETKEKELAQQMQKLEESYDWKSL